MSEKNILEVSRDLGQCTGGNWSPVQGYDSIGWYSIITLAKIILLILNIMSS